MSKLRKQMVTLAAAATLAMPMAAMATNGILPLGNGMAAHGVGGAGIANGVETMSAVDNPALTSKVSKQWAVGASVFNPNRSIDVGGGYVASANDYFIIPQGGWLTNINDKMDWGILAYAMGGMNTEYPANTFGAGVPVTGMNLEGFVIAPTISYKFSEKSSIGFSLLLGSESLETKGPAMTKNMPDNRSDSATGYGFKVGYVVDLGDTNIGLTYQSAIKMDKMTKHCEYMFSTVSDCALNLPPMYGVGVTQKLGSNMKLVADVIQVKWSDVAVFKELFGWEDQTILKIGLEFKSSTDTTFRVGLNHGKSPIPDNKVQTNLLAPAITEDHYTVGMTNKLGKDSDLTSYFAYVPENEQTDSGTGAKAKMDQLAIGVGYNVHF